MAPLLEERRSGSVRTAKQVSELVVNLERCLTLVNSSASHPRLGQCTLRRRNGKSDDPTRCIRTPTEHSSSRRGAPDSGSPTAKKPLARDARRARAGVRAHEKAQIHRNTSLHAHAVCISVHCRSGEVVFQWRDTFLGFEKFQPGHSKPCLRVGVRHKRSACQWLPSLDEGSWSTQELTSIVNTAVKTLPE